MSDGKSASMGCSFPNPTRQRGGKVTQHQVLGTQRPSLALRASKASSVAGTNLYTALEHVLARPLPVGSRWRNSVGLFLVLSAALAAHGLALLAQPLMLYPDSTDFVGRAYRGLQGDKVWRGDYQFLPGFPYFLYWLSKLLPCPINTPLRLAQHGCLMVSHLCAFGVVHRLTRSRTFAVIVGLTGVANLSYLVLGNQLITEPLYSAAVSFTALLLCAYAVRPRLGLLVLAGLAIGLGSLVRATGVYMAWLPVALVTATVWQSRTRPEWPRPGKQLRALAGCLGLAALCVGPVIYLNRARLNFWGLTHYLGINLYARVVEFDGVYDAHAPAQRRILELWEKHQARAAESDKPAWQSHWPCANMVMQDGGLTFPQA